MAKPDCLIVCHGKSCRRGRGFDQLMRLAAATPGGRQAPCQGMCHGPMVAVRHGAQVRWFSHVRSKSLRKLVAKAFESGRVPKRLAEHEVKKRRGTLRHARRLERIGVSGP